MVKINRYGLATIWVEIDLALLETKQPDNAPLNRLGRFDSYRLAFQKAQEHLKATGQPLFLGTPWTKVRGQHFWTRYFDGTTINEKVSPLAAWQFLTPFRSVLPAAITALAQPQESADIQGELFFYSFGVACVITHTISSETPLTLQQAVDRAHFWRHDPSLAIAWHNNPAPEPFDSVNFPVVNNQPITLNHLGDLGMRAAYQAAFGPDDAGGKPTGVDPLTVFCVLEGGIEQTPPLLDNSDVHKGMQAVTTWKGWQNVATPLDQSRIHLGENADIRTDMLYATRRGRAIWYPKKFNDYQASSIIGLRCYWRNLVFATLQTESLVGFASALAGKLSLSAEQNSLGRRAAGILGRLYGGTLDTYRSRSIARQIEDNAWVNDVNMLRQRFGMGSLNR